MQRLHCVCPIAGECRLGSHTRSGNSCVSCPESPATTYGGIVVVIILLVIYLTNLAATATGEDPDDSSSLVRIFVSWPVKQSNMCKQNALTFSFSNKCSKFTSKAVSEPTFCICLYKYVF